MSDAHDISVSKARALRNKIVHEGSLGEFEDVGHESKLLLDAKIGGVSAGEFAVETWRNLRELVSETIGTAPSFRP
jgi:hypothetical protein